jgi:hypothetical protein
MSVVIIANPFIFAASNSFAWDGCDDMAGAEPCEPQDRIVALDGRPLSMYAPGIRLQGGTSAFGAKWTLIG